MARFSRADTSIPSPATYSEHVPGVEDFTLTILDGLVEVETVQVEVIVETPSAVNQIPTTFEIVEEVKTSGVVEQKYWKIRRPK